MRKSSNLFLSISILIFATILCICTTSADSGALLTNATNGNTINTTGDIVESTGSLPEIIIDTGTKTIYISGYVNTGKSETITGSDILSGNSVNTGVQVNTGIYTESGTNTEITGGLIKSGNKDISPEDEFANALAWMYANGLTMYDNSGDYRMYDILTREEAAKIIGQAYTVFGLNTGIVKNEACTFSDANLFNPTLSAHITNVCQWGLFQGSDGKYMPRDNLTKAQSIAVLVRMIEGKMSYELQTPRWEQYYTKGKLIGLTNVENINEFDHDVTRYEIALMVYRMRSIMESSQMKTLAINAMGGVSKDTTGVIDSQTVIDNLGTLVGGIDPSTDPELLEAIYWMSDNGLTIHTTVADYKPFDILTREGGAKIFDRFSDMLGLGVNANYLPEDCSFTDISGLSEESQAHIVNVCKKGLIKGSNGFFNPGSNMNKSTFIVALIRMFEGKSLDETTTPRWKNYFQKAEELGLVTAADTTTFDTPISRYEVALFLYKFNVKYKMLNSLNNNKVSSDIINTVSGSVAELNGKQNANIYINTAMLKQGTLELGYVEIFGNRYKIVKTKETSYYSNTNSFMRYGDIFDIATDEKIGTINFMVQNNAVIEGTLRFADKTYKITTAEGTNAYYKIIQQ